jgi:hypothetical protein
VAAAAEADTLGLLDERPPRVVEAINGNIKALLRAGEAHQPALRAAQGSVQDRDEDRIHRREEGCMNAASFFRDSRSDPQIQ